jgi:hypothetical protein
VCLGILAQGSQGTLVELLDFGGIVTVGAGGDGGLAGGVDDSVVNSAEYNASKL